MIKLFIARAEGIYDRLEGILFAELGYAPEIKRTGAGKPFIEGDPLFFSVAHSGLKGAVAISDKPVGVDLELFKNSAHKVVAESFSQAEQDEIKDERDFLKHWTVREAFVKMRGSTLAQTLKSTEYTGGNLFFKGELQNVDIFTQTLSYGIVTVCAEK